MSTEILELYKNRPERFDPLADHPDPDALYMESLRQSSLMAGREKPLNWELDEYLSEAALHRYRALVDIEALIYLSEAGPYEIPISDEEKEVLRMMYQPEVFDPELVLRIDHLGYNGAEPTEHDVKAGEVYLGLQLEEVGLGHLKRWLHYGETSEDTNNLAYNLMLRGAVNNVMIPATVRMADRLAYFAVVHAETPLLALTHAQGAAPHTVGKRIGKGLADLTEVIAKLEAIDLTGKFGGAVGGHNVLEFLQPEFDWDNYSRNFVESFGFKYLPVTDQRNNHLAVTDLLNSLSRVGLVSYQVARNAWLSIRDGVLVQQKVDKTRGSSTMSHKINPWRLEGAEGLFEQARDLIGGAEEGLVESRDERELSDHPWERAYGDMLGRLVAGLNYMTIQFDRLLVDEQAATATLKGRGEVLSELLQTAARQEGDADAYDKVTDALQGKKLSLEEMRKLIEEMLPDSNLKIRILELVPEEYLGNAPEKAREAVLGWHACKTTIESGVLDDVSRIDAVLFDFDSTLHFGDKEELQARLEEISRRLDLGFSSEQIQKFGARSDFREMRQLMIEAHGLANPDSNVSEEDFQTANNEVSGMFDHLLYLGENAEQLLRQLKASGKKIGLVTTRGSNSLPRLLELYGISDIFDVIVNRDGAKERKPHPQPIAFALEQLGVSDPSRAIYVGDKQVDDVIAGNALGMQTVLVGSEPLDPYGARPTHHYSSLEPLLKKFSRRA